MATNRSRYDAVTAQRNNGGAIFKTADYTAKIGDRSIGVTPNGTGDVTVTLPSPREFNQDDRITVWSNGNAANDVVVVGDGSERVAFTSTLTTDLDRVTVSSDGEFYIVDHEVAT